jgi:hypothetical protein
MGEIGDNPGTVTSFPTYGRRCRESIPGSSVDIHDR